MQLGLEQKLGDPALALKSFNPSGEARLMAQNSARSSVTNSGRRARKGARLKVGHRGWENPHRAEDTKRCDLEGCLGRGCVGGRRCIRPYSVRPMVLGQTVTLGNMTLNEGDRSHSYSICAFVQVR